MTGLGSSSQWFDEPRVLYVRTPADAFTLEIADAAIAKPLEVAIALAKDALRRM